MWCSLVQPVLGASTLHCAFRVDASSQIGLGHLMRCLSLAQALSEYGVSLTFYVNSDAVPLIESRRDWVGDIEVVPDSQTPETQLAWLTKRLTASPCQVLVLDGYQFDGQYRQRLSQISCLHVCFDDNNQLPNLHTDLVINGAGNARQLDYQRSAANAAYCLGDKYRVLRSEFNQEQQHDFHNRTYLTITMGGSDPANLTIPLVTKLDEVGFAGKIQVITGAAYPWVSRLSSTLQGSNLIAQHSHDCQHMAQHFNRSRVVVSAAGGSQFELQACGCPSLLVVMADNQYNATQQATSQGWCEMWDLRKGDVEQQLDGLVSRLMYLWHEDERLSTMSEQAYLTRDISGAKRVAMAIFNGIRQRNGSA